MGGGGLRLKTKTRDGDPELREDPYRFFNAPSTKASNSYLLNIEQTYVQERTAKWRQRNWGKTMIERRNIKEIDSKKLAKIPVQKKILWICVQKVQERHCAGILHNNRFNIHLWCKGTIIQKRSGPEHRQRV